MSSLETNARYSIAMSILNNFRHWLTQREGVVLHDENLKVLQKSIDINQTPNLSSEIILYSFQGFGNNENSAALELSDALSKVLRADEDGKQSECLDAFKRVLESKDINVIQDSEKDCILKLITDAMYIISSQTEQKSENFFIKKDL
jgi:hypothetical protein